MSETKFWMLKGSAGAPVQPYFSRESAEKRAQAIAEESGRPCYVLEAIAVYMPEPRQAPVVVREVIP